MSHETHSPQAAESATMEEGGSVLKTRSSNALRNFAWALGLAIYFANNSWAEPRFQRNDLVRYRDGTQELTGTIETTDTSRIVVIDAQGKRKIIQKSTVIRAPDKSGFEQDWSLKDGKLVSGVAPAKPHSATTGEPQRTTQQLWEEREKKNANEELQAAREEVADAKNLQAKTAARERVAKAQAEVDRLNGRRPEQPSFAEGQQVTLNGQSGTVVLDSAGKVRGVQVKGEHGTRFVSATERDLTSNSPAVDPALPRETPAQASGAVTNGAGRTTGRSDPSAAAAPATAPAKTPTEPKLQELPATAETPRSQDVIRTETQHYERIRDAAEKEAAPLRVKQQAAADEFAKSDTNFKALQHRAETSSVPNTELEDAKAARDTAQAKLDTANKALEGPQQKVEEAEQRIRELKTEAIKNADAEAASDKLARDAQGGPSGGTAVPPTPQELAKRKAEREARQFERDEKRAGREEAKEDVEDIKAKVGKGKCAHASQIGGGTDCGTTSGWISASKLIGGGSEAVGQLSTQIMGQREIEKVGKDGASQGRQMRGAAKMAKSAADVQAGVATINAALAFFTQRQASGHEDDSEKIKNETEDPDFVVAAESGKILFSTKNTSETIAKRLVSRDEYNSKMLGAGRASDASARQKEHDKEVARQFTSAVSNYGNQAASEHAAMAEKANESWLTSTAMAVKNALGAWGNYAAAKQLKEGAKDLEKSGDFTVPDFQSEPFPTEADTGRQDVTPNPQPSVETAQADVLPENDVPNLGDGFKLDPNEKVQPGPVAGAFKPDENRAPAGAGGGGGLSGSGTNAASAEDKQTPQAQYAGLGNGSGTFEREGGRGGNAGRGANGRGESNGALTDMMGYLKGMFGKEDEGGNKKTDFMALSRQTANAGNDGLLGRGVNIFDRISMTYTSRAKTGTFGDK